MNTPPDLVALSVAHASYDNLLALGLTRLKKKGVKMTGQNMVTARVLRQSR